MKNRNHFTFLCFHFEIKLLTVLFYIMYDNELIFYQEREREEYQSKLSKLHFLKMNCTFMMSQVIVVYIHKYSNIC